jgi:uncharacterized delta-60 repeat protein
MKVSTPKLTALAFLFLFSTLFLVSLAAQLPGGVGIEVLAERLSTPWPDSRSRGEGNAGQAATVVQPVQGTREGEQVFVSSRDGNQEIYRMNADGSGPMRLTNNTSPDYQPQWSPDGSKIVFVSERDGNAEIYTMNPDGSNQVRLTSNAFADLAPSISPNGSKIVFRSQRGATEDIYVMDADGGNQVSLSNDQTANEDHPRWSPDGTKIVFIKSFGAPFDIYVMNANGTNQVPLTSSAGENWFPDWSPDGTKIAFQSSRTGNFEVFTMNADGGNQLQITTNAAFDGHPAWSHNGALLAFDSNRDGNFEIYTMLPDGNEVERVTNEPLGDFFPDWRAQPAVNGRIAFTRTTGTQNGVFTMDPDGSDQINLTPVGGGASPSWSPDGNKIAYISTIASNFEIFVMNSDGTGVTNITNSPSNDQNPDFSPDGNKIAFLSDRDGADMEIWTMDVNGANPVRLTTSTGPDIRPAWSPDGTKIVFQSFRDGNNEIYVMNANGSNQTRLTTNAAAEVRPKWSHDGSKIVFHSERDGNAEIYVMDANGANQTRLTNNAALESYPAWSPDGSKIIFTTNRDGNNEIYTMDPNGANQTRLTNNSLNDLEPDWGTLAGTQNPTSAWWRAEGNADDSNGPNHGTLAGNTTFTSGRIGQAFSFDGTGDSVDVPSSPLVSRGATSPLTVTLWAFRANGQDRVHILGKRDGCDGDNMNYQMGIHSEVGLHVFFGRNGNFARTTSDIIPVNQWTMLTGTFDGTTFRLYKDAQLVGSQVGTLGPETTAPLKIGSSGSCGNNGEGWHGRLDEVRIYDRALSAGEIQAVYAEASTLPQISGQITKNGAPLAGVSVALTGSSTVTVPTDASGNYAFRNLNSGGSYTITPTLQHHKFTPVDATFNNVVTNQTQNFTAVENCHYTLARTNQGFASNGGMGGVAVTAPAGCPWTAVPNQPWISIASPSGNGNGGVSFQVAANTGEFRTGSFTLVDQTFTINQGGVGQSALDSSYNARVTEAYNSVYSTIVQPDGKIVIGGIFQQVSGVDRRGIERLNPDGTRDLSFNATGGIGLNDGVRDLALQPDGKIIAVGLFSAYNGGAIPTYIIRLNADGTRDTSFNLGTGLNGPAYAVELQPDGKIVVGGGFTAVNGVSRASVARLNSDGTLDTSFNAGSAANSLVRVIRLQPDGKMMVGGTFSTFNGATHNALLRLNSDGSVDGSFDVGTGVTIDNDATVGQVLGMAIQADGKVLIGGSFNRVNGNFRPGLTRLNSNGTLDATFVRDSGGDYVTDILVLPNSQIYVSGGLGPGSFGTLRLNSNGSLDNAFQGQVVNDAVSHANVQADGKVILSGNFTDIALSGRRNLVRLETNGAIDTGFNPNLTTTAVVNRIVRQADGKALVMGNLLLANGTRRSNIARFNADGTLDTSFDPFVTPPWSGGIQGAAVQPDGKIVVGGSFLRSLDGTLTLDRMARLNADGSHDPTFVNGAPTLTTVRAVHVLPDGKILAGGLFNVSGTRGLVRLNSNGSLDATFNVGTGANGTVTDLEVQADGKILIAGTFTQYNGSSAARVARLNADGSLDGGFTVGSGANSTVNDLDLQPDGKVLIGGAFTTFSGVSRNRVARLNADGTLDTGFDIGTGANSAVSAIKFLPGGKVLVGGAFINFNSQPIQFLAKLNSDGSIDNTFFSGFQLGLAQQNVLALAAQADGKALVGGVFRFYNGVSRDSYLRLSFESEPPSSAPFDFDGDGKTDIGIFRPSDGTWWINRSSNGITTAAAFGTSTDIIAPADFTGDRKTDIAFFRPSNGYWFVLRSEDYSFYAFPFGTAGDVPTPADFDGDDKADTAVFRPSIGVWFILRSSDGGVTIQQFGQNGDLPVTADYDGDGRSDLAIFRPADGTWWLNRSTAGVLAAAFGNASDKPTPGDFTGDGKADVAFWRPSTGDWGVLRSEDLSFYGFPFGTTGDIPAPGDYDGDGKMDATVFRPSQATWYSFRSTAGVLIQQFGSNGDRPVPNAFVP